MQTQIIRETDKYGRLYLGTRLIRICSLKPKESVAICRLDDYRITIRRLDDTRDCEIIAIANMETKGRIKIPWKILEYTTRFEIYVKDLHLILEEAH